MIKSAAALAVALFTLLMGSAPAFADPAAPTDYRSEIVSVEPDTPTIEVSIVGGDSFVKLRADPGTRVTVLGYSGEPYLVIEPDGTVFENRRSPATYLNEQRFGADVPTGADAAAPPEWTRVGHGGAWAWHDHRAHWMEPFAPLNAERGDQVLDAVIPLVVDDVMVDVRVVSTWMPQPSPVPMMIGLVSGLVLVGLGAWRRQTGGVAPVIAVASLAAGIVGALQYRSLPESTDPLLLWWAAPAMAFGVALVSIALARRTAWQTNFAPAAAAIAGIVLVVWAVERRTALTRAVLPTDAPYWIDRIVTAGALSAGVLGAALAVVALLRPSRVERVTTTPTVPARSPG